MQFLSTLLLLIIIVTNFTVAANNTNEIQKLLQNKAFILTHAQNSSNFEKESCPFVPQMYMYFKDGNICSFYDACNTGVSTYSLSDSGMLTLQGNISTLIGCMGPEAAHWNMIFSNVLMSSPQLQLTPDGNYLMLFAKEYALYFTENEHHVNDKTQQHKTYPVQSSSVRFFANFNNGSYWTFKEQQSDKFKNLHLKEFQNVWEFDNNCKAYTQVLSYALIDETDKRQKEPALLIHLFKIPQQAEEIFSIELTTAVASYDFEMRFTDAITTRNTYACTWIEDNYKCGTKVLWFDEMLVNNHTYKNVLELINYNYNKDMPKDKMHPFKIYFAEGVGIIRMEYKNGDVYDLLSYALAAPEP